jgi:hypothetical protein
VLAGVREKVAAAKGLVAAWSAPVGLAAKGELGPALLAEAFRTAREADPQARLVAHAGNVLGGMLDKTLLDRSHAQIRSLLDARAPIQAIALGARFEDQLISPERVWDILDRFAEFRLPLLIADHEIDTWDGETQADYTRDLLTAAFAHQATSGFLMSGFWAGEHPVPNAAFFTNDWTPRPHAKAWQELVYKKWWTQTVVSTNGKGMAKVKGYLGDYAIEVRADGKTKTIHAKLGKNGRWLEISL